jgi:hypothetical protein
MILFNLLLIGPVHPQNIFLIERPGTVKNFKFYEGDDIHVRVKNYPPASSIKGTLTGIRDSSIIIDDAYLIPLKDITAVYKDRFWLGLAVPVLFVAGVGYVTLEAFNRLINNDSPVVTTETAIISGSLVAGGFALIPLKERKFKVGEKWRVKSLIFD